MKRMCFNCFMPWKNTVTWHSKALKRMGLENKTEACQHCNCAISISFEDKSGERNNHEHS